MNSVPMKLTVLFSVLMFSLNGLAVKNSMFNLTEQTLKLVIQPKADLKITNADLKNFWQVVKNMKDVDSLEKYLQIYPPIISEFWHVINENVEYYIVDKMGLTKMKEKVVKQKLLNAGYEKEFNLRLKRVENQISIWRNEAIDEALVCIINCLNVTTIIHDAVSVDMNKVKEIGGDFKKDVVAALKKITQKK